MEIILGIIILCISIAAMSIGVIFNRKPLSGSCGGLNPNRECSICRGDINKCENSNIESASI
ncbi:MAG: (Na+)-NQR maturation NqrM [Candidatus Neomarinimicrobiota bacterium]